MPVAHLHEFEAEIFRFPMETDCNPWKPENPRKTDD